MVRTRGNKHTSDSDDEAPEEVTNITSKALAEQEKQEQRQAARAAATPKRKQRGAAAQQQQPEPGDAADGHAGPSHAGGSTRAEEEEGDVLPEDLLQQLAEQRRRTGVGAVSLGLQRQQATQQQAGKAAQQAARKRHRLAEVHKGPVTVKVLKAAGNRTASDAALNFKQQQLAGSRVKRSTDMLAPPGARHFAPSAKFA